VRATARLWLVKPRFGLLPACPGPPSA
jgi:hypothetical protein